MDYEIKVLLDRAAAASAVNAQVADFARVEAAAARAFDRPRDALGRFTREASAAATATERAFDQAAGRYRDVRGRFAAGDGGGGGGGGGGGLGMLGRLAAMVGPVGAAMAGISALADGLGKLATGLKETAAEQRTFAAAFDQQRDSQREVASMAGKQANAEYTLAAARERLMTGLTAGEQTRFMGGFLGSGQQFIGKNISEAEAAKFRLFAQQQAAVLGIEPEVYGELSGTILGARDWTRFGDAGGAQAARELYAQFKIMQEGQGRNKRLAAQAAKAAAALQSEEEFKGIFKSPTETGIAVSAMAEGHPDDPETYIRAAVRALHSVKPDAKKLLDRAKVTPQTDYFRAFELLAPLIEEEARLTHTSIMDVVKKYFHEEREAGAVTTMVQKGLAAVKSRRTKEAELMAPGVMEEQLRAAYEDPTGAMASRLAKGEKEEAQLTTGEKTAVLETYRTRAEAVMLKADQAGPLGRFGESLRRNLMDIARPSSWLKHIPFFGEDFKETTDLIPKQKERETQHVMLALMAEALAKKQGGKLTKSQEGLFSGLQMAAEQGELMPGMYESIMGDLAGTLGKAGVSPSKVPANLLPGGVAQVKDPEAVGVLKEIRDRLPAPGGAAPDQAVGAPAVNPPMARPQVEAGRPG